MLRAENASATRAAEPPSTPPATRPSRRKMTREAVGGGGRVVRDDHDRLALVG